MVVPLLDGSLISSVRSRLAGKPLHDMAMASGPLGIRGAIAAGLRSSPLAGGQPSFSAAARYPSQPAGGNVAFRDSVWTIQSREPQESQRFQRVPAPTPPRFFPSKLVIDGTSPAPGLTYR